jgi:prepilin-type N-terminal cleavage/methylation domain-containing protein
VRARRLSARRGEDGFTLVEVIISMMIFAVISLFAARLLLESIKTTNGDRTRVAAANLALREVEFVRATFDTNPRLADVSAVVNAHPLPGGTAGQPLKVDNHLYNVALQTNWVYQNSVKTPCEAGTNGQLAYLLVQVTVTWDGGNMGGAKPVMNSTLLTPPVGTFDAGQGHLRILVKDDLGAVEPGTRVNLLTSPGGSVYDTGVTSNDGCVLFAFVPPGNYTAVLARDDGLPYVDVQGNPAPSQLLSVVANTITSYTFAYANANALTVNFDATAPLFPWPTAAGMTLYNGQFTVGHQSYRNAAMTTVTRVWPFPSGLTAWSGYCTDADPQFPGVAGVRTSTTPALTAGGTSTLTLTGVPVTMTVVKSSGALQSNAAVYAINNATGCDTTIVDPTNGAGTQGDALALANTGTSGAAAGVTKVSLPYGVWNVRVKPSGSSSWVTPSSIQTTITGTTVNNSSSPPTMFLKAGTPTAANVIVVIP